MRYPIFVLTILSLILGSSSAPRWFAVDSFGAKGDGVSDSTEAFAAAWKAACGSAGAAVMLVPKGEYVVQPVTFWGKCRCSHLTLRIDGWLMGPTDYGVIATAESWIQFEEVENLVIQGGVLRGRAKHMLQCSSTPTPSFDSNQCPFGGRMLSIAKSNNVWINNITSIYSQGFHIDITYSQNVHVFGAKIIAPESSPNTDGVHVGASTGVTITSSTIQTGDDCISLIQGSQNIWIQDIFCGPGHGISIGSLAGGPGELAVRNVTAKDVRFRGTQNGFRIKTWAKPFDVTINDVYFLNAVMTNVNNPIIIDQFYCPSGGCSTSQPSYVKISNVEFSNINGTSASEVAIKFDCSPKFPCSGLSVQNVQLRHVPNPAQSEVEYARVRTVGVVKPGLKSK